MSQGVAKLEKYATVHGQLFKEYDALRQQLLGAIISASQGRKKMDPTDDCRDLVEAFQAADGILFDGLMKRCESARAEIFGEE